MSDKTKKAPPTALEPRLIKDVRVFGPDLLATDPSGRPLSPIASAFPHFRAIVTGRTIHAMQSNTLANYLSSQRAGEDSGEFQYEGEDQVLHDAVALHVRPGVVLIRSEPEAMEHTFAADELLQQLVEKEQIQFTGAYLPKVRAQLRRRGESWRISQPPHTIEELCASITGSRTTVGTGSVYYHNPQTGSRFLTYAEFMRIRPLLRGDPAEAVARLEEIVHLTRAVNSKYERELVLFLRDGRSLEVYALERVIADLQKPGGADIEHAEAGFDQFAAMFAAAAGDDLCVDDVTNATWRMAMFCRLANIDVKAVEEAVLGLSQEFHLHIRWLPGARIVNRQLVFERKVETRVYGLITHFWKRHPGLVSINVGRVENPLNPSRPLDERRDVLLIVLGFAKDREEVHIARMARWDVVHRLGQGKPLSQAIGETVLYCQFIFDRLRAATELRMPIPRFEEIEIEDELPGGGLQYPVYFFSREYVPGIVSHRIPSYRYGGERRDEFIVELAGCLGHAATVSLVLGRVDTLSGRIHFDDGDEIIQLDANGIPCRVVIAETTGSFHNWWTPMKDLLPQCLVRFAAQLAKAREQGVGPAALRAAIEKFTARLIEEVDRTQELVRNDGTKLYALFADRRCEDGGMRCRWESVLKRIASTKLDELRTVIETDPALAPYRGQPV